MATCLLGNHAHAKNSHGQKPLFGIAEMSGLDGQAAILDAVHIGALLHAVACASGSLDPCLVGESEP